MAQVAVQKKLYPVEFGEAGVTNTLYPRGHVKRYGATGDSATLDDAALNAAWVAAKNTMRLSAGIYLHGTNLIFAVTGATPLRKKIIFEDGAELRPTAGVVGVAVTLATDTNSDGTTNRLHVKGMRQDGVGTAGLTGTLVGENAAHLSGRIKLEDVEILRFGGVGGKGLYIKDAIDCEYENVYVGRCYENIHVEGSDIALPTTQKFRECSTREATTKGLNLARGYRVTWDGGVIESNLQEGVYSVPVGGANVLHCWIKGAWLENNNTVGNFQVLADGTNSGTTMLSMIDCYFSGVAKSISYQKVHNFKLDGVYPSNLAGAVTIDPGAANQSSGDISNWPENNAAIATRLVNNAVNVNVNGPATRGKIANVIGTGALTSLSGTPDIGTVTARFGKARVSSIAPYYAQPAFGAVVTPDFTLGNFQQVNASSGIAFQIANPSSAELAVWVVIQIRNTSGGALGALTWGSKYRGAPTTTPANGQQRSFLFVRDPGLDTYNYYSPAADIPN